MNAEQVEFTDGIKTSASNLLTIVNDILGKTIPQVVIAYDLLMRSRFFENRVWKAADRGDTVQPFFYR